MDILICKILAYASIIVILFFFVYSLKSEQSDYIRGCTGFDGDLEIMEAIDGPGPSQNLGLNINADDQLAYAA